MAICSYRNIKNVLLLILVLLPSVFSFCDVDPTNTITLKENTVKGTLLRNISTEGEEVILLTPNDSGLFEFTDDGALYANKTINVDTDQNEELCQYFLKNTVHIFRISCAGVSYQLIVLFEWSNDFPSRFPDTDVLSIREHNAVNEQFATVGSGGIHAVDEDCNTAFYYSIQSSSPTPDLFRIDSNAIVVTQILDYELIKQYKFNLSVETSINSESRSTAFTEVKVDVIDVDDLPPEFGEVVYVLEVKEQTNHSLSWLETSPPVSAHDGDVGVNDTIIFTIKDTKPSIELELDEQLGYVKINEILDREQTDQYRVILQATETNNPLQTAISTLEINVVDVNDNRPVFEPPTLSISLREDASEGQRVVLVTATDADLGPNSEFDYAIRDDSLGAFNLTYDDVTKQTWLTVSNTSALRGHIAGKVAIETKERQPIADGSLPCDYVNVCLLTLTLTIKDVNVHTPEFTEQSYDFVYDNDPSRIIGKMEATDNDRGNNSLVSYSSRSISTSAECGKVKVEDATGAVKAIRDIFPGTVCSYLATACDNPADQTVRRCSSVPLVVSVANAVNTSGSVITSDVTVLENIPVNSPITSVPYSTLMSNVTEFHVKDSWLMSKSPLDRETKDLYHVGLSTGADADSLVLVLHVHVDDVNDNAPQFTQSHYEVVLPTDAKKGDVILQVNATDNDIEENARLTYELITASRWFSMQSDTGELILQEHPIDDSVSSLDVSIVVKDAGTPSLQDVSVVKVILTNDNGSSSVILPVSHDQLMTLGLGEVARKLSQVLASVEVTVVRVESLSNVPDVGSAIFVTGTWSTTAEGGQVGESVPRAQLDRLLAENSQAIYDTFKQYSTHVDDTDDGDDDVFTLPFIVLLCVCAALFLLVLILVCLLLRSRKKNKRNVSVIDKLTRDTSIYNSLNTRRRLVSNGSAGIASSGNNSLHNGPVAMETIHFAPREGEMTDLTYFENPSFVDDEDTGGIRTRDAGDADSGQVDGLDLSQDAGSNGSPRSQQDRVTSFRSDDPFQTTPHEPRYTSIINVGGADSRLQANHSSLTADTGVTPDSGPGQSPKDSDLKPGDDLGSDDAIPRRNSVKSVSEADSGIQAQDDNDITGSESRSISSEDKVDDPRNEATKHDEDPNQNEMPYSNENLDIMTARAPPTPPLPSSRFHDLDLDDTPGVDEPEPDYAKKVRFGEVRETEEGDSKVVLNSVLDEGIDENDRQDEEIQDPSSFFFTETEITAL